MAEPVARCSGGGGATRTTAPSCRPPRWRRCARSWARRSARCRRCRSEDVSHRGARAEGSERSGGSRDAVGEEWVREDRLTRVTHAAGKGYPDLVRMRAGAAENAPDAVVYPASAAEVRGGARRLRGRAASPWCRSAAARAWWAASSRCGTADGRRDLARPRRGSTTRDEVDTRSLTAVLGAGPARARRSSARSARDGLTLGPLPAVVRVRDARRLGRDPLGRPGLDRLRQHREAGRRAALRGAGGRDRAPRPARDRGRAGAAPAAGRLGGRAGSDHRGHAAGAAAARRSATTRAGCSGASRRAPRRSGRWSRAHVVPDVARLSDEAETRLSLTLSEDASLRASARAAPTSARAATRTAASRSSASRATRQDVDARRARARRIMRRGGGLSLGAAPGRAWLRQRYEGPYLRDALLDHGIMGETLETAAPWSRPDGPLRGGPATRSRGALEARGTPGLVMCHISHLYPDGASLYFTFLARAGGGRRAGAVARRSSRRPATRSWQPAARSPTTTRSAATTLPWMPAEVGELGRRDAAER